MSTDVLITRTKIVVPRRRTDIVTRQRLLNALDDLLDFKLLIVAAPAGYGKTTLMVDYCTSTVLPVCWFSLDALDQNTLRFVAHFIASIQSKFPSFGRSSYAALENMSQGKLNLDVLVTSLVNDIYENITEHFAIVLDDYQLVSVSQEVNSFINRFIQDVDENCHMALVSRTLLTLPDLPLMIVRSQVSGLSFEELAFSQEEIKVLLEQNYQRAVSDEEAAELYRQSEGWITGLLLSAQLSTDEADSRLRIARVSGVDLYEYLAQQVLAQQPEQIQQFLYWSSLLDEFDASFCEEVIGKALNLVEVDWASLIREVMHSNLYVLPVGEDRIWLRYHHLFQAFLQKRVQSESPQEREKILTRLAEVYIQRKEWERAFDLYRMLGRIDEMAGLVERAGSTLISTGRVSVLSTWIDELPTLVVTARPGLLSLEGGAAVIQGRTEEGLLLLNQAIAIETQQGEKENLVHALLRRSNTYRLIGKYEEALSDVDQVLAIAADEPALRTCRAEAMRVRGMAQYYQGRLRDSLINLNQSLSAYQEMNDEESAARVMMEVGMVEKNLGNGPAAEQAYTRSLKYWNQKQNSVWQANLLNNLGVLQHLRGDFEAAATSLESAIQQARRGGYPRLESYGLASIGDIYRDLDAYQQAREAYEQARVIAQRIKEQFLLFYLDVAEAGLARLKNRLPQAHQFLNQAKNAAQLSGSEYQKNLVRLEMGLICLLENKLPEAEEQLLASAAFFNAAGQRVEAARAYFYAVLVQLAQKHTDAAKANLEQISLLVPTSAQRYPLYTAGRELSAWISANISGAARLPLLAEILETIKEYEISLPRMRRQLRKRAITVPFAPPRLIIRSLGKTEVRVSDRIVTTSDWKTQASRDLFFLFLNHPEGMTKEQVGEIFWPESSPAELRLRFKNTVYRLRHAVGRDTVSFYDEIYRFNYDLDYEYDLEIFTREIAAARSSEDLDGQISHYRAAAKAYRGPFLPDVDETWALTERERLAQMNREAWLKLGTLYLESHQYDLGLEACRRVNEDDPCFEDAYRLAMNLSAAAGNRAGVVRQFEMCRQALKEELGVEPSHQTRELFEKLSR